MQKLVFMALFLVIPVSGKTNTVIDYVVAQVNNDIILASELRKFTDIQMYTDKNTVPLRSNLLDALVLRKIQLNIAKERGIKTTDSTIGRRIESLASARNMSLNTYLESIEHFPGGIRGFSDYLNENIIIEELQRFELQNLIQVDEQEARRFLLTETGQQLSQLIYTIGFIAIDKNQQSVDQNRIDQSTLLLESEVDFYDQATQIAQNFSNTQQKILPPERLQKLPTLFTAHIPFMAIGEVVVVEDNTRIFLVKLLEVSSINPTFREQVHVRHILLKTSVLRSVEQTHIEIENIYERILEGESFSNLAKTYSEDVTTAHNGGFLPWSPYDQFVPEFADVAKTAPIGELIGPIETVHGLHLIEVLARKTTDVSEQTEILNIRNYIFQQKITDELPRFLSSLQNSSFIVIHKIPEELSK